MCGAGAFVEDGRVCGAVVGTFQGCNVARALYRCGDRDGLGRRIFRRYERDLQGPIARHAHAVFHGD